MKKNILCTLTMCFYLPLLFSQQAVDLNATVFLNADYSKANSSITLKWNQFPQVNDYVVYSRLVGQGVWGPAAATLTGQDTSYTFENISEGQIYEYRVRRNASAGIGEGYIHAGIDISKEAFGNTIILLIDASLKDSITQELAIYKNDLIAEGWKIEEIDVARDEDVVDVRNKIINIYSDDPQRVKSVFIIGHVPVPYSGNIAPDGHPDHRGAWPCDGYYGELTSNWTDSSVMSDVANNSRHWNIPGDGKFDQNSFPSNLELAVARVDFYDMPAFADNEIELLKKYFRKNHLFRTNKIPFEKRGLVENNFGLAEGFGQGGYRNLCALVGRENTYARDFNNLSSESYLWSYGAGPGSYTSAGSISNTANFSTDSIQTVFTMLFGSYFGDWDSRNNFLRAALATGTTLSNAWSGRPHWYFHPMVFGQTLGDCAILSMNNSGTYVSGIFSRTVHMALMGDPSLRMEYIEGPTALELNELDGNVELSWKPTEEENISGYHVYRQTDSSSDPVRLTDTIINQTSYLDSCLTFGASYRYYVSAIKLLETPSGCYFNESPFIYEEIEIETDLSVDASFEIVGENEVVYQFENNSIGSIDDVIWDFGDGISSNELSPEHTYSADGEYCVTLIVSNACFSDTTKQTLQISITSTKNIEPVLSVFPNPVSDQINIDCQQCGNGTVRMSDATGKVLLEYAGMIDTQINLEEFSVGVYFIEIVSDEKSWVRKITKE